MRSAEITRETRETKIRLSLCLEGGESGFLTICFIPLLCTGASA